MYTFKSFVSAFLDSYPVIIEVVDGSVSYVYNEETYEAIDDFSNGSFFYYTIEERFDLIEKELANTEQTVVVTYDERYHYPKKISVNLKNTQISDAGYTLYTELLSEIACTQIYVLGLSISMFDKDSNTSIGCPAIIDINSTRDEFSQQLTCSSPYGLAGLGERAGLFDITVNVPHYKTKLIKDVRVNKNLCHVIPVHLEVYLEKE